MNQVYPKVFRSQIMPIRDSLKGVHQNESTKYLHIKYDPGVHMSIPNNQIGPIHYTYWKGVQEYSPLQSQFLNKCVGGCLGKDKSLLTHDMKQLYGIILN